jgi:hypothetical protein
MQIDYVKISCKEDVHICHTNFAKEMEWNLHETTSRRKTYGKRLFCEDLEVRDVVVDQTQMVSHFEKMLEHIGKLIQKDIDWSQNASWKW